MSRTNATLPAAALSETIRSALRFIDAGKSIGEVAEMMQVHRLTLERAMVQAKARQGLIRQHLQTRSGLTSLLRYPDRGPWGKGGYFGNCTGYLVFDLLDYYMPRSVFDPMEGSGTTGEVCFDLNIPYVGRDLKDGFDLLSSSLPDQQFDLIFWHPPYWPGHRYSHHPNDFSTAKTYPDFLERLVTGLQRLCTVLAPHGHLILLIGDGRKQGVFYPIHTDLIAKSPLKLEAILIKDGEHPRRARHYRYGPTRFIPTLHEYVLIFQQGEACTLPSMPE